MSFKLLKFGIIHQARGSPEYRVASFLEIYPYKVLMISFLSFSELHININFTAQEYDILAGM